MAIGVPYSIGTATGTSVSSRTITTTAAVAQGSSIFLEVALQDSTATINSVVDSVGNVYTHEFSYALTGSPSVRMNVFACHGAIALPGSSALTVTASGSVLTFQIAAFACSGLRPTGTLDGTFKTSEDASGLTPNWVTASTGAMAQAQNLVVAYVVFGQSFSNTPEAGWTELADVGARRIVMQAKSVSVGTAITSSGTAAAGTAWITAIAVYKGLSAPSGASYSARDTYSYRSPYRRKR